MKERSAQQSLRFARLLVALALALVCACCLAACGDDSKNEPTEKGSQTTHPSDSKQVEEPAEGTPLFQFIAEKDPSFKTFATNFNVEDVVGVQYNRDNFGSIWVEDKEVVQKVYNGLSKIVVLGPYTSDEMVTDASESIVFTMKDGSTRAVHFDFGNLVLKKDYYELDNKKALVSALIDVELAADENQQDIS